MNPAFMVHATSKKNKNRFSEEKNLSDKNKTTALGDLGNGVPQRLIHFRQVSPDLTARVCGDLSSRQGFRHEMKLNPKLNLHYALN